MLAAIGRSSIDELFAQIPASVRLDRPLAIADGVSEMELVADLRALAARNRSADDLVCFAGGGAYDHYVPSVVWALAGRSELYTSYTPYQPELSQGVLQVLFEYQSMICELTGLEVSNASLYDGATALVEAVHMTLGPGRSRVLVSVGRRSARGRGAADRRQGSGVRARDRSTATPRGDRRRRRGHRAASRTCTACSSRRGSASPPRMRAEPPRSRSSTRSRSACSPRRGSSAPTSRWGRARCSGTI